ncbi:MAG: UDP-glucose 4-epimerase [Syntrophaceae bacterium]|nr:MAG: UDP-glucose 4-epimerase [Syntrophaceae bacterium]
MNKPLRTFISGGAGYIGSHCVKALGQAGHDILVYDNLSTGHEWALLYGRLVKGDLADANLLDATLKDFRPDAVIHFAASIQVEESTRKPLLYYRNNVINSVNLLEAMLKNNIHYIVYSSTAAVYGTPDKVPVDETMPLNPINPYGATKAMVERILADTAKVTKLHYMVLRYFNVAGADIDGELGQAYQDTTHLITRAIKTALGQSQQMVVYGTDYPTKDGTCIRDYVHVNDLAEAHVLALDYMLKNNQSDLLNCGYGHGFSVKEVIQKVKSVSGIDFKVVETGRRPADSPEIIAANEKIKKVIHWEPKHDDLDVIIKTAWEWEKKLQKSGKK